LRFSYHDTESDRLRNQGKLRKQISHEMGVSSTTLKKALKAMKKVNKPPE
jgi:predicted DNA-binding protein (UPF0251 family)